MKSRFAVIAALFLAGSAMAQVPVEVAKDQQALLKSADPKLAANKKLVFDFWREVLAAGDLSKAEKYLAVNYKQHNPAVPTGLKGFQDYFKNIFTAPKAAKPTVDNLVDVVAERDLVVLALREELDDPKKPGQKYTTTWFDMFRVTDGKISEHWDYGTKK